MAGSRPLLLVALLAVLAVPAGAAALPAPVERDLRVVVLPLERPGERAVARTTLERGLRRLTAYWDRISYGRLRVTGAIAPPYRRATRRVDPPFEELQGAIAAAEAGGVLMDGGIPVFIQAAARDGESYANSQTIVLTGRLWTRSTAVIAHEIGHVLGLDHARAPSACPGAFRPATCAIRPADLDEFGDRFDLMGPLADRLGAYGLAALRLAPVRDAPARGGPTTVRPLQDRRPTLLRLRAATHDWLVESRTSLDPRYGPRFRVPAGVAVARVPARYTLGADDQLFPNPVRVPAAAPLARCDSEAACTVRRQLFRPGATLTVPGAFRLRVLGRGPGGSTRVRTTWLDRSPPRLAIERATIVRRFGGAPELVAEIRAAAAGAGVASVLIDQAGTMARIDPDTVPGLVAGARGRGLVRAPLAPGASAATLRLVDAAGNRSRPARIDLAAAPSAPAASIVATPALGAFRGAATPVARGGAVVVSGATDPSLAGLSWRLTVIGTQVTLFLPIAADGTFSGSWTPAAPGLSKVRAEVPVERIPGSIEPREQVFQGWVRA